MIKKPAKIYLINEIRKMLTLDPSIRILDMGSGTSVNFDEIFQEFPQVSYTGIELSPKSSKIAKDNYEKPRYPGVRIINQPAYLYSGETQAESFDLVVSLSVLEHVKDLQSFLDLSVRSLKPGGRMIHLYDLGHSLYPKGIKEKLQIRLSEAFPSIMPENKFCAYVDLLKLKNSLEKAGIIIDRVSHHSMRDHVSLLKSVKNDDSFKELAEAMIVFENLISEKIKDNKLKEKLMPSVAVWGHK